MALNLSGTSGITGAGIGTIDASGSNVTGVVTCTSVVSSGAVSGTTGTFTGDVSIADKIIHTGDTDTAIRFSGADTITAETGGSERLRIASNGKVGVNTTAGGAKLTVDASSGYPIIANGNSNAIALGSNGVILFGNKNAAAYGAGGYDATEHSFKISGTERLKISSDGSIDLSVSGTEADIYHSGSGDRWPLRLLNSDTTSGNMTGIYFGPCNNVAGAYVAGKAEADFTSTANRDAGLEFGTRLDGNWIIPMSISAAGNVGINNETPAYKLDASASGTVVSRFRQHTNTEADTGACILLRHAGSVSGQNGMGILFQNSGGTKVGNIDFGVSTTQYRTSSDYRLKENEELISNGIERLKTLKPYRFNFKEDPSTTVDGFFAHEAQEVVPYAVSGEKDGEDMQGIDYGKLTPLLTAALQEAIVEIETLKTKVAALESA